MSVDRMLISILLPCIVLEIIISLVVQLFVVLHNGLLIRVCQVDVGHVPLLVSHLSSSLRFSVSFLCPGPFFCNSFLLQVCFLCYCLLCPPGLLLPLFLCLHPFSCLPFLPSLLDICSYVPQLKFRNTVSGNFYLFSLLLRCYRLNG